MSSFSSLCVQSLQSALDSGFGTCGEKYSMNKAMLMRLFLDRVLGNVSIIEECARVGVQAGGVLREERIGVKINNEGLKCQRKRVKGERGDGIDQYTGGVCVWR